MRCNVCYSQESENVIETELSGVSFMCQECSDQLFAIYCLEGERYGRESYEVTA